MNIGIVSYPIVAVFYFLVVNLSNRLFKAPYPEVKDKRAISVRHPYFAPWAA